MSTERKVAVITGASQGIGAGLVRGYLDRGYLLIDMMDIERDVLDSEREILNGSSILTDGEWNKGGAYGGTVGGTDQQRAAMEALNAEGACTALAVLGASASAADPDHGQQITRRLTNLDGLALLFREVASRMIEERLSA